ncbi:unnamed protein product [Amoebophrya sp. A120]|nr:unnamed protein product [Amoebophrya sp. A120]|eukprot:GSA120T00013809001.1
MTLQLTKHWACYPQDQYDTKVKATQNQAMMFNHRLAAQQRAKKLFGKYKREGMQKSFACVLMCFNAEGHPCLILKKKNDGRLKLVGGKIKVGESTVEKALYRKMKDIVFGGPTSCQMGELLSVWYRPNFDELLLPYLPLHENRPKERVEVYQVVLPEKCILQTGSPLEVVPLHELSLLHNECPILASLPAAISRFALNRMEKDTEAASGLPPGAGAAT